MGLMSINGGFGAQVQDRSCIAQGPCSGPVFVAIQGHLAEQKAIPLGIVMTFWQNGFVFWIALAISSLMIWVVIATLVQVRRGPVYRRSRVYSVWPRQKEFRIRGVVTLDDVARLIGFLQDTYEAEIIAHDPEPDETMWRLSCAQGQVELLFDDHEQTRIRSVKNGGVLFDRLVRDIHRKRSILF